MRTLEFTDIDTGRVHTMRTRMSDHAAAARAYCKMHKSSRFTYAEPLSSAEPTVLHVYGYGPLGRELILIGRLRMRDITRLSSRG
jgi:hypothetical protein